MSLKPSGMIGIVNYKKDGGGPGPAMEERVDPEQVIHDALARRTRAAQARDLPPLSIPADVRPCRRNDGTAPLLRGVSGPRRRRAAPRSCRTRAVRSSASMAYTALAPSKQVRAVLVLLCAELCRGRTARAVPAAAAIELVHASSLILDDLPSMDDAPLRRGRPANHLEFGEAIAILAAFGLLNLAYGTIARAYDPPTGRTDVVAPVRRGGPGRPHRRAGARPPGHRPANQLRDARADSPRQDGRAVRRRRHLRRDRRRRRGRADRGAVGVREEPRARVPDCRRPPGRVRRPGRHG